MIKKDYELIGLVGDYNWEVVRNLLLAKLIECKSEKDLTEVIELILSSVGSYKDLTKIRKKIGIKQYTNQDKEKFK